VYAKPVNADEPLISFYQTGCFTAMIENPKIVSRVYSCSLIANSTTRKEKSVVMGK
jgi:hypothetical protein